MPLRSIAFLFYFFGSSAAALAVPMAGVLCYIMLYHVNPQTTWWGQQLDFMGLRYSFICGICLLIGTSFNLNKTRLGGKFIHPAEWAFLVFALTILISLVIGLPWHDRTYDRLDKLSKVFLFTFMMTHVVVTRQRLWQLAVMFTILALYLGHEAHTAPPSAFDRNRLDGIGGPDFRESAGLAIHLFALLPFVAVVLRQKTRWLKLTAFFAACYAMNAILLCRARSAFVAAIITGTLSVWLSPRKHRRWITVALICGAVGACVLSDSWFWDRMATTFSTGDERDNSAAGRLEIWGTAWIMFTEYPLGLGVGQFQRAVGYWIPEYAGRDAHNTYILCLIEMGVFGLIAYLGVIATALYSLSQAARRVRKKLVDRDLLELLIFANQLAILIYAISSFFVSRLYTEGFWWFLMLPAALSRAVENEIRAEAREPMLIEARMPGMVPTGRMPMVVT